MIPYRHIPLHFKWLRFAYSGYQVYALMREHTINNLVYVRLSGNSKKPK